MDTLGALALGTEAPQPSLLCRRPYKLSTGLVSRPIMRNIFVQSACQLAVLFFVLFAGKAVFVANANGWCLNYEVGR